MASGLALLAFRLVATAVAGSMLVGARVLRVKARHNSALKTQTASVLPWASSVRLPAFSMSVAEPEVYKPGGKVPGVLVPICVRARSVMPMRV